MDSSDISDHFIEALTTHQMAIKSYIRASMGGSTETDDVAQKTNIVLWRKASQWDPSTPFLKWAFSVARFEVLAHYRDQSRSKLVYDEDVMELMGTEAAKVAETVPERILALRQCLAAMKPDHQQLLSAKYITKMPILELATHTSKSEDAVKSLLLRLRKKLNKCISSKLQHS